MFFSQRPRRFAAVLVSAMMALPMPTGAHADASSAANRVNAEAGDVPVILQRVQTTDGRIADVAIAPVPVELEAAMVQTAAKHAPDSTVLMVSGKDDPALKAALASGQLNRLRIFIADPTEKTPLAQAPNITPETRSKFVSTLKKVDDFIKAAGEKKYAILMAVYVASVYGSFTFIESSSVASAAKVFGVVLTWVGFQTIFTHHWDELLDGAGKSFTSMISSGARLMGRELTPASKTAWTALGSFYVALGANVGLAYWAFLNAGEFESTLGLLLYGFANAYDIFDKNISNLVDRGRLAKTRLSQFVGIRVFAGTLAEVMSMSHVPYVQTSLTLITASGLLWLALGPDYEDRVVAKLQPIKLKVSSAVGGLKRAVGAIANGVNTVSDVTQVTCQAALMLYGSRLFRASGGGRR